MLTINDFLFESHPSFSFIRLAQRDLNHQYVLSIIQGPQTYGDIDKNTFEVAIVSAQQGKILYNLTLKGADGRVLDTSDVLKYLSVDDVNAVIQQLQSED